MPSAASAPSAKNKLKTPWGSSGLRPLAPAKRVNPIARSLRSGHLRPRVVPSKKTYTRRSRTPERT
jgi:hypothetical protein